LRLSTLSKARTDDAFLPGVNPISETLTGAQLNCGTRPVGFCEKGERTPASTVDFTIEVVFGDDADFHRWGRGRVEDFEGRK
jgi:hypothetical protein